MMNRLVLIPAEFLTAAGAAAGNVGAKMSPPPLSDLKSIRYAQIAQTIGTFQSMEGLGRASLCVYQRVFKEKVKCKIPAKDTLKKLPRYLYPTYLGNLPQLT